MPRPSKSPSQRQKGLGPLVRNGSTRQEHKESKARTAAKPRVLYTEHESVIKLLNDGSGKYVTTVDPQGLFDLALTYASFEQMASILKVDDNVLKVGENLEIINRARAHKLKELSSAQFATAISDRNPTMQIWLGKQHLGQKDKVEYEGGGRNELTVRVVAVMPPNGRDLSASPQQRRLLEAGIPADAVEVGTQVSEGVAEALR